jgi:hypothetical protein
MNDTISNIYSNTYFIVIHTDDTDERTSDMNMVDAGRVPDENIMPSQFLEGDDFNSSKLDKFDAIP